MYYPGEILVWVAFAASLLSAALWLFSIKLDRFAPRAWEAYLVALFAAAVAVVLLGYLFLTHDFRLQYVWRHSDTSLSTIYLISGIWAGHEGSLLLWVAMAALGGLMLKRALKSAGPAVMGGAMAFQSLMVAALSGVVLAASPFRFHEGLSMDLIPADGAGMNPLLRNPWMVIHPPATFAGYVLACLPMAVLAGYAVARRDAVREWIRPASGLAIWAVAVLGVAIALGGAWSYVTLGWGGYWGWDPVENASLVPWLGVSVLLHGFILERRKGVLPRFNMVVAAISLVAVLYSTFLTRSGVLADFSVHSFADLGMTRMLLALLILFSLLCGLVLVRSWGASKGKSLSVLGKGTDWALLVGLLLMLGMAAAVAVGTSAPIITKAWGGSAQVGTDYYSVWLGPPVAVLLALAMAVAVPGMGRRGLAVSAASALVFGVLSLLLGVRRLDHLVYLAACGAAAASWVQGLARWSGKRARLVGTLHLGLVLMLVGFRVTGAYQRAETLELPKGKDVAFDNYRLSFEGPLDDKRFAIRAVRLPGGKPFLLTPAIWVEHEQTVANPGIRLGVIRDLYVEPKEYSPSSDPYLAARLIVSEGRPDGVGEWKVEFRGFEISSAHQMAGSFKVKTKLVISKGDGTVVEVEVPAIHKGGVTEFPPVGIPGVEGAFVRLAGMDASTRTVAVDLLGLWGKLVGSARLGEGDEARVGPVAIRLKKLSMARGRAGLPVAKCELDVDGKEVKLDSGSGPVDLGVRGLVVALGRVWGERGIAEVLVLDPSEPAQPEPERLVVHVSLKPLVSTVWFGALLAAVSSLLLLPKLGQRRGA